MERIKTFIQKLQEVYYSKHPKSAIDIDLMLDYTRIMYVDLLEWRKDFTDPVHSDIVALIQANNTNTSNEVDKKENMAAPAEPEIAQTVPQQAKQEPSSISTNAQTATEEAIATESKAEALTKEMQEEFYQEDQEILPEAPKEITPEVVSAFPEEESIAIIVQETTGISFEPPVQAEKSFIVKETLTEEAPTQTPVIEEIPAPAPAEIPLPEFKPYAAAKLFDGIVELKDIRTSIGINDKYLFLNELFNNHKSDYEETLDKINRFSNIAEANEWIKTKAPVAKKWDAADPTVQSFYALLDKHFNVR